MSANNATATPRPIATLLVANRGEIALRVVRTAKEMGIRTVAVYAEQDRHAQYVRMADEAYLLSGDTYAETYLNQDRLIEILERSGADAVHPGYGFLSEVPSFAQAVLNAGAAWLGPNPTALEELGDKISARKVAKRAHVPPVPGISEPISDMRPLLDFAHTHGYPLMLKRADGGGGRGITLVRSDDELRGFYMNHDALQGGDLQAYFVELFIDQGRHVETQCGRDAHGNFTVYSTRDCSLQRRNQKLIEEAPAPFLTPEVEEALERNSRALFEAVDYVGLGTCEFMVTSTGKVYFLEVNPRLQVEHTVSEEVCGLDLVREQITIASGGTLTQPEPLRGHSFELRITCEDPNTNLAPSSGTLTRVVWPSGPGIRVDSGVVEGDTISPKFDSMMGKLIVTAQDRRSAIARVRRALEELVIEGVPTPAPLFAEIFRDHEFTAEDDIDFSDTDNAFQPSTPGRFAVSTKWMERKYLNRQAASSKGGQPASLSAEINEPNKPEPSETFVIEMNGKRVSLTVPSDVVANITGAARMKAGKQATQPLRGAGLHHVPRATHESEAGAGVIAAPMQAIVTRINVAEGQEVAKGDLLVVLESMKMENYVYAPTGGTVTDIQVAPAAGVEAGDTLMTLDVDGTTKTDTAGANATANTAADTSKEGNDD
ncbi:biotin carboxylase N-terminal domain-containing protein [Bifidobacterium gallicum]|nr:biotin carboxylase N-terminal domain-containing protein [Bifidobacterium gallicum]EFA22868.1 Carbamoyl-phosphate synthase L chain, ATP binding domain protein [Bifidobacterium gallicum DSM 20093 = LMG 11596]